MLLWCSYYAGTARLGQGDYGHITMHVRVGTGGLLCAGTYKKYLVGLRVHTLGGVTTTTVALTIIFNTTSLGPIATGTTRTSISTSVRRRGSCVDFRSRTCRGRFLHHMGGRHTGTNLGPIRLNSDGRGDTTRRHTRRVTAIGSRIHPGNAG